MALNLGELYATITADNRGFNKSVDGADRRLDQFTRDAQGRLRHISGRFATEGEKAGLGLGDGIDRGARPGLARLDSRIRSFSKLAFPTLIAGAGGAAVYLTAALLPAVGALTALPAAAVAAKIATTALTMALDGVGDALGASLTGDADKFNEKLKELPPTTRGVVKELGSTLGGLQKSTQEAFFGPMKSATKGLAADLKGPLKAGFADVGDSLGGVGAEVVKFVRTGKSISVLKGLFAGVGSAIDGIKTGVKPLLAGVRDLIAVFIPGMGSAGQSIGDAMARWGAWMSQIAKSGKAMSWFTQAKEALKSLWGIGQNVARIISGIFGAADGGNLLATIEAITAKLATWVNSAEGQQQLGALFESLGTIAQALLAILPGVGGALMLVAQAFNALPAPLREGIATVLAFSVVAKGLGGVIGPTINAIDNIGNVASKIGPKIMPAIAALGRLGLAAMTAAGKMAIAAARVVGGWILMGVQSLIQAARMAVAWIIALGPIAWIIAAIVAIVALVIVYWDEIISALETAWNWIADLAQSVWNGIVDFFSGIWDSVMSAFETSWRFIIGLVKGYFAMMFGIIDFAVNFVVGLFTFMWDTIVAGVEFAWNFIVSIVQGYITMMMTIIHTVVTGIVTFLTGAWEWIKSAAVAVWNALVSAVKTAWNFIKSAVQTGINRVMAIIGFLRQIPARAAQWFQQMKNAAVSKLTALISWAKSVPGKVLAALGKVGSKLLGAGRSLIQGLLNGMKAAWSSIKSWILGALKGIKDAVLDFFGISSPSKLFAYYGRMIGTGLAIGLQKTTGLIGRASAALNNAVAVPDADMAITAASSLSTTAPTHLSEEDRNLLRAGSAVAIPDDQLDRLADRLAERPAKAEVAFVDVARAADRGQRQLVRRG